MSVWWCSALFLVREWRPGESSAVSRMPLRCVCPFPLSEDCWSQTATLNLIFRCQSCFPSRNDSALLNSHRLSEWGELLAAALRNSIQVCSLALKHFYSFEISDVGYQVSDLVWGCVVRYLDTVQDCTVFLPLRLCAVKLKFGKLADGVMNIITKLKMCVSAGTMQSWTVRACFPFRPSFLVKCVGILVS